MKDDFYSLLDRYLAGDLSPSEEAAMRELAKHKPKYGALLREARQYSSLISSTLLECQQGTASAAEAHDNQLDFEAPDLSQIDSLMAGMLSPQQEQELRNNAANSPIFASELKDADALAELLTTTLHDASSEASQPLVSGHELVDRYMAGDLDATEQAELLSLANDDSSLSKMLDEARDFETLMMQSLKKAAQGHASLEDSSSSASKLTPELTLIDDLIDRYMAGELTEAEYVYLQSAAKESSSVARKLQEADSFAALLAQPARQSNTARSSSSARISSRSSASSRSSSRSSASARSSSRQTPVRPAQASSQQKTPQPAGRVFKLSSRRVRRRLFVLAACLVAVLSVGGVFYALEYAPNQDGEGQSFTPRTVADIPGEPTTEVTTPPVIIETSQPETPKTSKPIGTDEAPISIESPAVEPNLPKIEENTASTSEEIVEAPLESQPTSIEPNICEEVVVEGPPVETTTPSAEEAAEPDFNAPSTSEVVENEDTHRHPKTTSTRVKDIIAFLDADTLVMREQAFISFRQEIKDLQLDDGTFNIWGDFKEGYTPTTPRSSSNAPDPANEGTNSSSNKASGTEDNGSSTSQGGSDSASSEDKTPNTNKPIVYRYRYIPEKTAVNALCVRALLVAGEPASSKAVSKGIGAVIGLYQETLGLGVSRKLSTQDAASILSLFERYYSRSPDRHGNPRYNRVSNEHAKIIHDIVLFLAQNQHEDGLWAIGGNVSYGKINHPGTITHWAGREVEYDFVSTFAAIRGIEAAKALRNVPIEEDAYLRLAATLIKLQSPQGVSVEQTKVQWDKKRQVYTASGHATTRQARGFSITGDLYNEVHGRELQRNGLATASAVYMLGVCRENIRSKRKNKELLAELDRAYQDALAWLEYYFSAEAHPHSFDDERIMFSQDLHYLYLFSMHEALTARSSPILGSTPWYRESVAHALKELQTEASQGPQARESLAPLETAKVADPFIRNALGILLLDDQGLTTPDGKPISTIKPE